MARVIGNQKTIEAARTAPPGARDVYINWAAIQELPDEYEVVITEVTYNPANLDADFYNVGTKSQPVYMPQPQLMYRIAEACGISGVSDGDAQALMEEVDINPMLMLPLDAPPTMRRMIVGRRVSKQSRRLQEDGTYIYSSICTSEYNAWERCLEAWTREEAATNGYTQPPKWGEYKYNSPYKRRAHFQSELKFAHAKAETKAHEKTIRELAGLMTGYQPADLMTGKLIFAKVRRSRQVLQAETAARLAALSRGEAPEAPLELFGPPEHAPEPEAIQATEPEVQPELTPQKLMEDISYLIMSHKISDQQLETRALKLCKWIEETPDADKQPAWQHAIELYNKLQEEAEK